MTIDERIEALRARHEAMAMDLELMSHDVERLLTLAQQDGENIRAIVKREGGTASE